MKLNKKSEQKKFLKDAILIAEKFGSVKMQDSYELNTIFGKLYISIEEDNSSCYGVFMRFEKLDLDLFSEFFPLSEVNNYSFKWNILYFEAGFVLQELEERLSNLVYANKVIRISDALKPNISDIMELPEAEINEMFKSLYPNLLERENMCSYR